MVKEFTSTQPFADQAKSLIEQPPNFSDGEVERMRKALEDKQRALKALHDFEAAGWYPWAMESAMEVVGPGQFTFVDGVLHYEPEDNWQDEYRLAVAHLLEIYGCIVSGVFGTEHAAIYLGKSASTVKYHVHIAENLRPTKVGNSLAFTLKQLNEFKATQRPQGRPRKDAEGDEARQ